MKDQTDLLEKRYPNLSFLLRFHEKKPLPFPLILEEEETAIKSLSLENLEAIYIYGLGLGKDYFFLKQWLAENKERELILLEENLSVLETFLKESYAEEILMHPQVHLRFNLDKKRLTPFLQECAAAFPLDKIGITALPSYKKHYHSRFYRLRLQLRRFSTVQHAIFLEKHYYNLFFKNLLPNFRRMDTAFDGNGLQGECAGIPAIICGAGPSIENDLNTLRGLDNRALIFAGGSAITALSNRGIRPHFGVAIDPNFEEVHRFRKSSAFEIPLFYASRLHPEVFDTFNGPHGYLHTKTGGRAEGWIEEKLGLNPVPLQEGFTLEALSVTTTAIELAATLGCSPIILLGVDLAFTNNQAYTSGVVSSPGAFLKERKKEVRASERLLSRKDIYNKPIHTLVKWVMESSAIGNFAKKNPHIEMLNATSGGIGCKPIPNVSLQDIPLPLSRDLHGLVHQMIQTHPFPVSSEAIRVQLETLRSSLIEAEWHIQLALDELENVRQKDRDPETGRLIFAQMELETLDAYACFLEEPAQTFIPCLNRKFRPTAWNHVDHSLKWSYLHAKWHAYQDLVTFYLKLLPEQ